MAEAAQELVQLDLLPRIQFYDWEGPAFTYGITTSKESIFTREVLPSGIEFAQRPTGGGVIYHERDIAFGISYSKVAPLADHPVVESYHLLHRLIIEALELDGATLVKESDPNPLRCCQSDHTIYDTLLNGRKVIGSAQRRGKQRIIHQVSLFIAPLPYDKFVDWGMQSDVYKAMQEKVGYIQTALKREEMQERIGGAVMRSHLFWPPREMLEEG
jgi:lipoate-protein ligase A